MSIKGTLTWRVKSALRKYGIQYSVGAILHSVRHQLLPTCGPTTAATKQTRHTLAGAERQNKFMHALTRN